MDIFDKITAQFKSNSMAKRIASLYSQPLRLNYDYGEKTSADFLAEDLEEKDDFTDDTLSDDLFNDELDANTVLSDDLLSDDILSDELDVSGDVFADTLEAEDLLSEDLFSSEDDFSEDEEDFLMDDRFSEFYKESRFHKGEKGRKQFEKWLEDQPEDFQEKWEENKVEDEEEMLERFNKKSEYFSDDDLFSDELFTDDLDFNEDHLAEYYAEDEDFDDEDFDDEDFDDEDFDDEDFIDRTAGKGSGSYMSLQNIREMNDQIDLLEDVIEEGEELEDWVEDKISRASQTVTDLARYYGYGRGSEGFDDDYDYDDIEEDL